MLKFLLLVEANVNGYLTLKQLENELISLEAKENQND